MGRQKKNKESMEMSFGCRKEAHSTTEVHLPLSRSERPRTSVACAAKSSRALKRNLN